MLRRVVPLLLFALPACSGSEHGTLPAETTLVNDSLGAVFEADFSPDETRLAWSQIENGRAAIWVGDPDGSHRTRLTHGVWDVNPVWSPDGRWIAYHGDSPSFDVLVVPSEGGEPRQLTSGPASETPVAWTRDGSGVVYFQQGAGDVRTLIAPLDGAPSYPIVAPRGGDQYVMPSPDGSKAIYDLHRGGQSTVWVQDLPNGTPRQIGSEGFENLNPTWTAWSPDSRYVAFTSRRTGTLDLWIADVESGDVRQLTHDVRNDNFPRWSPDGRWIAFVSDRGGQVDVWVIPSAGGNARRVTNDRAQEIQLAWSHDGRSLRFLTREIGSGIGVTLPDGGPARMLVDWPGYSISQAAALSPDGRTVLFASDRSGNMDLWTVPFAGGEAQPFATSPLDENVPSYSPDGSQVVFQSNRSGNLDLWVMPASGGEARQLTDWSSAEYAATWSPDGTQIAFLSNHAGSSGEEIWIVPSAGGEARRLTRFEANLDRIDWTPDGRNIYTIVTDAHGVNRLYRVPVTGGAPVALRISPNGNAGRLSPDGSQYAYASFDSGFAFIEVTPTSGGAPRRVTRDTSNVFDSPTAWSPDGTRLVAFSWQYGTDDAIPEAAEISVRDGAKRLITHTPYSFDYPITYTADGTHVLFVTNTRRTRFVSVDVSGVLAQSGTQSN